MRVSRSIFRCASISWFEVVTKWVMFFGFPVNQVNQVVWCDVMWCDVMWCDVMWCDVMWCNVMWCDVMWCDVMWCDGTSIHAMSMISHEISWWDISVVQVSMLCQWYLTKLVGEIFLWYKYPCYVNDISQNWLVRYFLVQMMHAIQVSQWLMFFGFPINQF